VRDFKIERPSQAVKKTAESSKMFEVTVNVKYEPITIGDSRSILKLNSPEGMEYTCLLLGKSTTPEP
jgi:hydrocephalus-inducing protein